MNDSLLVKIIAFLTGGATGVLTGVPPEYTALAAAMAADIITGFMCGFKGHSLHSRTMKDGLKKKVGIGITVGLCHILEPIGFPEAMTAIAVWGFIGSELFSVVKNLGRLGVPIPTNVRKRMLELQPTEDNDEPANPA